MMASTESAPAQRIPAWKKLGLKLRQPGAASEPTNGSSPVGQPSGTTGHKRKIDAPPSTDGSPLKRTRKEEPSRDASSSSSKPKKSVKFGETPTKDDAVSPATNRTKSKATKTAKEATPKKSKGPAKKQTEPAAVDVKPALEYLRQWKTSRESWKFNKNHQSTLIKHIFYADIIPAADVDAFYEYIRDLKGFVRTRLRDTAMEVKMQDDSDGTAGFPEDTMDLDDKQETYDSILADILRRRRQSGVKRKFFNEPQYIAESQDGDVIIRRVVKRMRAELVLEELSDSGEATDTTTSTSSRTITASDNNTTVTTDGDKRSKLNDGSGKRRRKLRVNMEDSSSSESESESGSDTSDSSSSSGDSDSEDEADDRRRDEDDTSSSSSSSSSSGESDSEDGSDEEE